MYSSRRVDKCLRIYLHIIHIPEQGRSLRSWDDPRVSSFSPYSFWDRGLRIVFSTTLPHSWETCVGDWRVRRLTLRVLDSKLSPSEFHIQWGSTKQKSFKELKRLGVTGGDIFVLWWWINSPSDTVNLLLYIHITSYNTRIIHELVTLQGQKGTDDIRISFVKRRNEE